MFEKTGDIYKLFSFFPLTPVKFIKLRIAWYLLIRLTYLKAFVYTSFGNHMIFGRIGRIRLQEEDFGDM